MTRHGYQAATALLVLSTLLLLPLTFPLASAALQPSTPAQGSVTTNNQPLFSWTDYAGTGVLHHYLIKISPTPGFENPLSFTTTTPYHQQQSTLTNGVWHWQVLAFDAADNQLDASTVSSFTLAPAAAYTVTADLSRYTEGKRVTFTIDAPTGSQVQLNVTSGEFRFPYATANLQNKLFTTFLDPGTYAIKAAFTAGGVTTVYHGTFSTPQATVAASTTHTISFVITDDEDSPLQDVNVTLRGAKNATVKTDKYGKASLTMPEGKYTIAVKKQGYFDDSFRKTLDTDRIFTLILYPGQSGNATGTPSVASTASTAPTIIITDPSSREKVELPFTVSFDVDKPSGITRCDALVRPAGKQGWLVAGSLSAVTETNAVTLSETGEGEILTKIRCAIGTKTYESEPRTFIVAPEPKHHEGIQDLLFLLDENKGKLRSAQDPLFTSLDLDGQLSKARKELEELDGKYLSATGADDQAAVQELESEIAERLAELETTLVISSTIVNKGDGVLGVDAEAAERLVKAQATSNNLGEEVTALAIETLLEDQASYTFRSRTTSGELTLADGTTTYVTGVTRTVQQFSGPESSGSVTVVEELPGQFLQQAGVPRILGKEGESVGTIDGNRITATLIPGQSYTLLFDGDVTPPTVDAAIAVIRTLDYTVLEEEASRGPFDAITGRVTGTIESTGLSPITVMVTIIAIAVLTAALLTGNISLPDLGGGRKEQEFMDQVHDVLDLFERGGHAEAFQRYPSLIDAYERLPEKSQDRLSFAITTLSSELHTHTMAQSILEASTLLPSLKENGDLNGIALLTNQIIAHYRELDPVAKTKVAPLLQAYQESLRQPPSFRRG